jgi:hypothetical protein
MPAEAVAQLEKAAALSPEPNTMPSLAHAYAISGQKEKALRIPTPRNQSKKESIPHSSVCLNLRLVLSDKEKGLAALEKAFEERSTLLTYSKMDPRFDPTRRALHRYSAAHRAGSVSFAAA